MKHVKHEDRQDTHFEYGICRGVKQVPGELAARLEQIGYKILEKLFLVVDGYAKQIVNVFSHPVYI
jgi:hypothetical protein